MVSPGTTGKAEMIDVVTFPYELFFLGEAIKTAYETNFLLNPDPATSTPSGHFGMGGLLLFLLGFWIKPIGILLSIGLILVDLPLFFSGAFRLDSWDAYLILCYQIYFFVWCRRTLKRA